MCIMQTDKHILSTIKQYYMKKIKLLVIAAALMLTAAGFTACGDDNEGGIGNINLPTPQYEQVSGKYEITSAGSPYESIELSASGNYIVTLSNGGNYYNTPVNGVAKSSRRSLLDIGKAKGLTRATEYDGVIYGTFTSLGGNEFALEGFGTIKLGYSGDEVTSIEVTTQDGQTTQYDAKKKPTMNGDNVTNALCRTWRIEKIRDVYYDKQTGETEDMTVTPENPGEDGYDMPIEVVWSKSGTYLVSYLDGSIGVAEWKWKNRGAGQLYYAWDGEWTGDYCTITFDGNRAVIHDKWEDEYGRDESWTYLVTDGATETPDTDLPEDMSPLANVFTGKLLKEMDGDRFVYENGYLTQIIKGYETITFRYNYITNPNAGLPDVQVMDGDEVEYEVELNEQGFAKRVYGLKHDDTSIFTYDGEGHITAIDDGREGRMYTLVWENGNLVRMSYTHKSDGRPGNDCRYEYDGQANTNNIMLYYKIFSIDLDEIKNLYYAGLLGKSTAQLPVKEIDIDDNSTNTYVWTDNGYTSLNEGETIQPDDEPDMTFSFYE